MIPSATVLRSNSFNFAPVAELPKRAAGDAPGGCPIYVAPRAWHPARHLLLDAGARVIAHHAPTRDFSDEEIARVRARGQLYVDRSTKPAPDEFPRDLELLAPAPWCAGCDRRARCATTYVAAGDPFTRAEAEVRARITSLARAGGRVVDVGAGEGRHGDLWEPAARAGRLSLVAIEPDAQRAAALATRWPWADVRAISVEELAPGEPLDAVVALRSWNHLADPAGALEPLVRALKPSGVALFACDVAFGLVRTAEQRRRAEASPATFEHRRDDDSHDALRALAALPLEAIEHFPVAAGGANQWLLVMRRK
jgi:2-polyprenyl-3-methyl-5-hydroxy-6-metoxy-1,4-benzoquinol methylase